MIKRQRRNALYRRVLGVGLGVSLALHGAVLGLGKLRVGRTAGDETRDRAPSTPRELPEDVIEVVRIRPIESPERPEEAIPPLRLDLPDIGTPADVRAEPVWALRVRIQAPVVPRPDRRALEPVPGFTPMHELDGPLLTRLGTAGQCAVPRGPTSGRRAGRR